MPEVEFKGIGASPGVTTGRVRLIGKVSPKDMNVTDGDIVVSNHLSPEQTVHFKSASGLIADVGGKSSHAAVIAREWNIPAVVGVLPQSGVRPTEILKEGNLISLNGSSGEIRLLAEKAPKVGELTEAEKARERFGDLASKHKIGLSASFLQKMDYMSRQRLREGD